LEDLSRAGGKGIGQRAWGEEQRASLKGFGDQVSAIKKFQITKYKYQTNHNDRNSKFQTIGF
jgi:hypothetical protein